MAIHQRMESKMVRLFKVVDDNYEEVKTSERLSNIDDAAIVASKSSGDGGYVADFGNGQCIIFNIDEGELKLDRFRAKVWVEPDLRPSVVYDKENPSEDPRFQISVVNDGSERENSEYPAVSEDF